MPLLIAISALIGIFLATRKTVSLTDNAKIAVGIESVDNISGSSKTIASANNNPLNIRATSDNWVGLAEPRSVKGFFNFIDIAYCYRAAKQIILHSYALRGVNTIREIISTYAPPSENETESYIQFVSNKMGVSPSTVVDNGNIANLLYAMTIIESGHAVSMSTIEKGLSL